jgi:hypothetical protein
MLEWQPVVSERITHEAYDPDAEIIYVRFPNGTEWCYLACPPDVWAAFTARGQSRGQFIRQVLDLKPNHRYAG